MGNLPLKQCLHTGCRELSTSGYCDKHKRKAWQDVDKTRGTRTQRGYDNRWIRARSLHLARHPFCVHCAAEGVKTLATELDHIIPHRGDMRLFWDTTNWQGLCTYHHRIKTASESNK